jgi:hypothetical protein
MLPKKQHVSGKAGESLEPARSGCYLQLIESPPEAAMNPQEDLSKLDPHRIIEQARTALERSARVLADAGMTPAAGLEALRRAEGDAAVETVRRSVAERLRLINEKVERDIAQATPSKPVSRYVAQRRAV